MALLKVLWLLAIATITVDGIRALMKEELERDIELERRLKLLNKPAIKTIKSDYGIYDCIDIYKQPAFDHPLLKDHKIQMKPTHFPDRPNQTGQMKSIGFGLSLNCPNGTVPIHRTTKEDLIREQAFGHVHTFYHPNAANDPNVYLATLDLVQDKEITGAQANIEIFNPHCEQGQASGAHIWLTETANGSPPDSISAGWMVDRVLYGDSRTHFTASWMGKGGGCSNLQCPGFVQVDTTDPLGFVITNISKYDGPLYSVYTSIYQDRVTKNWWLTSSADLKPIGYWPKELFSALDDGAKSVSYGGIVKVGPNKVSPQMGSGYREDCRYYRNAFIESVGYQTNDNASEGRYLSPTIENTRSTVNCPRLHSVQQRCKDIAQLGFYFMYGGPGGVCG